MDKIGLILVNYNSLNETKACLDSIMDSLFDGFTIETYVIDNHSADFPKESLQKAYPLVKFHGLSENKGFTGGNNIGLQMALSDHCQYFFLLNNDTLLQNNCLQELYHYSQKGNAIGLISPKIYFARDFEYHKERYQEEDLGKVIWYAGGIIDWENILFTHEGLDEVDHGQYAKDNLTQFSTGCAMFFRKEIISKVGFLDERYFLYLEDVDYSLRVKKAGYNLIYLPQAIVWHKNAASTNKPGSKIHEYYQTRNRLLFTATYASQRAKIAVFKEALKFLWQDSIKRKAVLDFFLNKFGRSNYDFLS